MGRGGVRSLGTDNFGLDETDDTYYCSSRSSQGHSTDGVRSHFRVGRVLPELVGNLHYCTE